MRYTKEELRHAKRTLKKWQTLKDNNNVVHVPDDEAIACIELEPQLYRVFTIDKDKNLEKGGRFYGAHYQRLNEEERARILINNEPTVELDFGSLHISMLYHREGLECPEDPYKIEGIPEYARPLIKKATNIIINAHSIVNAKTSLKNNVIKDSELQNILMRLGNITINTIIEMIKEAHSAVSKYFHSDCGVKLQKDDSDIAFGVIKRLMKKNILALIVHDSFIVQKKHEDELRKAMILEYKKKFGKSPVIK
ncbi:MAG: hypothetical protein ACOYVE_12290 [Melioribacter sp.]|uniref:hypothetical protein n=1 Tax=Melioribacter sp. TaxID=2052167 RepID=UPI003BE0279E